MPNWCANSLKLVATTAESEEMLSKIVQELARAQASNESASLFNIIKPIPEALHITAGKLGFGTPEQAALELAEEENLKTYGYQNWYEYCTGEWGTKWDARTADEDAPYKLDGNKVTIFFDTAWSPPMGIYYALESMGFRVEACYIEQGMGYIGHYRNGVDVCEKMEQFYTDHDEDEDDFPVIDIKVEAYFEDAGYDHMPSNFGG